MTWNYFEYADDLIARRGSDPKQPFQVWVAGRWKTCWDRLRFSYTAVTITDVAAYLKANPKDAPAFSADAPVEEMPSNV